MMVPIPFRLRREFPPPSITTFVILQVLDILTTMLGLMREKDEVGVVADHDPANARSAIGDDVGIRMDGVAVAFVGEVSLVN